MTASGLPIEVAIRSSAFTPFAEDPRILAGWSLALIGNASGQAARAERGSRSEAFSISARFSRDLD